MLTNLAFILAVVCFATTLGGVRYGSGPRQGGPGGNTGGVPIPGGPGIIPGGGLGGIPGGIGECQAVTPFHASIVTSALNQIGTDYTLRRIQGVRTQVVAGTMYHFELHVSKNSMNNYCEHCDVSVWHQLSGEYTLDSHKCREECCH